MSESSVSPAPAPAPRSRTTTRELWAQRLQRFAASGLTPAQFCAQEGVSLPSFYSWKRRLAAAGTTVPATPALLPVRLAAPGSSATSTDRATLHALGELLALLAERHTLETDYPAARLLAEAEALAQAIAAKERFYGPPRTGQFWLSLVIDGGTAPVRVFVPDAVKAGKPVPLVVALHGAGGTENLFFDAYGNGKIFQYQADTTLVALDAATGEVVWQVQNGDPSIAETGTSAPMVYKNLVFVGVSGAEFGVRGRLTAYDTETGKMVWRGYSTGPDNETLMDPEKTTHLGKPVGKDSGINTWEGDQWKIGGGTT